MHCLLFNTSDITSPRQAVPYHTSKIAKLVTTHTFILLFYLQGTSTHTHTHICTHIQCMHTRSVPFGTVSWWFLARRLTGPHNLRVSSFVCKGQTLGQTMLKNKEFIVKRARGGEAQLFSGSCFLNISLLRQGSHSVKCTHLKYTGG